MADWPSGVFMHLTIRALPIASAAVALALLCAPAHAVTTACTGDCDHDGQVSIAELMTGVGLVIDPASTGTCPAFDADRSGAVLVYEVIAAVRNALDSCPPPPYPRDDQLRLNQIQVLGTHNSYHIRPDALVLDAIRALSVPLAETLEYDHPP